MTRRRPIQLALAIALAATAGAAAAGPYGPQGRGWGPPAHAQAPQTRVEYAQVVRVDPIVEAYDEPVSREECWVERDTYQRVERPRSSAAPVLGAIVGGVVGNQFGDGRGRTAMTVAGAALGATVARDAQRGGEVVVGGGDVERCRVVTDYQREERVLGYDVTYDWRGELFQVQTDRHPGDRIRMRVEAVPEL